MKTQKAYKEKSWACPRCDNDNIDTTDNFEMVEENTYFPSECINCGLKWHSVYKLSKYEIISEKEM